jgi:hypothetical protein
LIGQQNSTTVNTHNTHRTKTSTTPAIYVQTNNVAHLHNHFALETQQYILCVAAAVVVVVIVVVVVVVVAVVVELHVTVNYIKIWSTAQQCFYGKFMSPATMQITHTSF